MNRILHAMDRILANLFVAYIQFISSIMGIFAAAIAGILFAIAIPNFRTDPDSFKITVFFLFVFVIAFNIVAASYYSREKKNC